MTSYWPAVLKYAATTGSAKPTFVPVSVSVGRPKGIAWVQRVPGMKELTPYGLLQIKSDQEFYERYYQRLEDAGTDLITERFETIFNRFGVPLVLLCWERPGANCHRFAFARWWKRETGQEVPEAQGLDPLSIATTLEGVTHGPSNQG
jgi:hypothetical protein